MFFCVDWYIWELFSRISVYENAVLDSVHMYNINTYIYHGGSIMSILGLKWKLFLIHLCNGRMLATICWNHFSRTLVEIDTYPESILEPQVLEAAITINGLWHQTSRVTDTISTCVSRREEFKWCWSSHQRKVKRKYTPHPLMPGCLSVI